MNLLGVDVGFARSALTTGLAWRIGDHVGVTKTGTSWKMRRDALPSGVTFSIVALDAPILPEHVGQPHRGCESVFYGDAFWNRCRPGLSHHGRGMALRRAGAESALQFARVLSGMKFVRDLEVQRDCALVEAFPNAFLGVLLPEGDYEHCDRRPNEHKSDWMYRKAAAQGTLTGLLADLGWVEAGTKKHFLDQAGRHGDHDLRAALICLLTAGFAAHGNAVVVGDPMHGWFWLPPTKFWQEWATTALGRQLRKLKRQKFPMVDVWTKNFFASAGS
jgi:hypothetical protein